MFFLSILLACGAKHADRRLPGVDDLFEASIAAAGGREVMMAHHNVITRGRVSTPSSQMTLTVYHSAPDTLYTTLEVPGVGVITSGYSDGTAWEFNPIMGPRLLEGDEAVLEARRADFYATIHYETHYPERAVVGSGVFDGAAVWEVAAQTVLGDEEALFFDMDTGLLRGARTVRRTASGAMISTTTFEEYREIDGILLPVVLSQDSGGVVLTITLDEVHYDVETMPSLEPPPVVRALIGASP